MNHSQKIIFDFTHDSSVSSWQVVDDGVMGGKSHGKFVINESGNGLFYGKVSLENNGGFSSVRHRFSRLAIKSAQKITLVLKGEGSDYQLRIKKNIGDEYAYVANFKTTSNWKKITINLADMQPRFRGNKVPMDNFSASFIEELGFLIGNKKAQTFKLEIDKIYLE